MTLLVPSSLGRGTSLRTLARPDEAEWVCRALASRRELVEKAAAVVRKGAMAIEGLTARRLTNVDIATGPISEPASQKTRRAGEGLYVALCWKTRTSEGHCGRGSRGGKHLARVDESADEAASITRVQEEGRLGVRIERAALAKGSFRCSRRMGFASLCLRTRNKMALIGPR